MSRPVLVHALAAAAVTLTVVTIGAMRLDGAARVGVSVGALLAGAFQIAAFSALGLGILKKRPFVAFLMQMMGRLAVFAATALVLLPVLALPAAPTLFSLVTVFFLTTLLEPVFLNASLRTGN